MFHLRRTLMTTHKMGLEKIMAQRLNSAAIQKATYVTEADPQKAKSLLFKEFSSRIKACGPISVAEYMKQVLTHPIAGYYMHRDVFGRQGDFVTSPELTQLFGEMIAIWIVHQWSQISNQSFQLIEFGPGRGTLMKDILRIFKRLKIIDRVSVHLIEVSPALSAKQAEKLNISSEKPVDSTLDEGEYYMHGVTEDGIKVYWYYSINDVPRKFSIILAHEFFDAMPIKKLQKTSTGWNEVLIDNDPNANGAERFRYVLSGSMAPASRLYINDNEARDHVEVSMDTMMIVDFLSTLLMEKGGFALIADYGHDGDKGDTFRGFRNHQLHDPLLEPGTADLTADVDFSLIKKIALKDDRLIAFGPVTQRSFLTQLGIELRLKMLLQNATEEQKPIVESAYRMITDNDKMGERFKFLALFPEVLKEHLKTHPVAGFQNIENSNNE